MESGHWEFGWDLVRVSELRKSRLWTPCTKQIIKHRLYHFLSGEREFWTMQNAYLVIRSSSRAILETSRKRMDSHEMLSLDKPIDFPQFLVSVFQELHNFQVWKRYFWKFPGVCTILVIFHLQRVMNFLMLINDIAVICCSSHFSRGCENLLRTSWAEHGK